MHTIIATESMPLYHQRFEDWLRDRTFKGNKAWIREIKFYDIVIPEQCLPDLMSDLLAFCPKKKVKTNKLVHLVKMFLPIKPLDLSKFKPNRNINRKQLPFWIKIVPVGTLKDRKNWKGQEAL